MLCFLRYTIPERFLNDSYTHTHFLSGGLAAVIYTDTLQTFVMIIGAIILTITGLYNYHNL